MTAPDVNGGTDNSAAHLFTEMGGSYTTIPNAPTAIGTYGLGINDFGKIVGYYVNGQSDPYGFVYDGSYTTLLNPAAYQGGIGNYAIDVNNSGIVVGFYNPGDHFHGFSYDGNTYTAIDDPLATDGTLITGINDQGQMVGVYFDGSGAAHAHGFLLDHGVFTTIDEPNATNGTYLTGINNSGEVVGYYNDANGTHGFTATPGSTVGETWNGGNGGQNHTGTPNDDTLTGCNGKDTINGGPGNDIITGGNGKDTFVFQPHFGKDVITDFKNDTIQFDHTLFANFAAVQAHSAQVGADTVITYDANDTVTLQGIALSSLHASDFAFV